MRRVQNQRQSIKKLPSSKTLPSVKKSLASTSSVPKAKYPISPPKTPGDSSIRISRVKSTTKAPPLKADIIVVNAINNVLKNEQGKSSFVQVFSAAQEIEDNNTILRLFEHLKEQIRDDLDLIQIYTVEDLIDQYNKFNKTISKVQSFMKFLGLKSLQDSRNMLPAWKYQQELDKHTNRCLQIGRVLWLERVHKRVLGNISKEIKNLFQNLVKNNNTESKSVVQQLYTMFKDLGLDYIESVSELFNMIYISEHKDKSPSEKLKFLMDDITRLSEIFPMDRLQELMFINHLDDFLDPLLKNRDDKLLPKLSSFLCPSTVAEYSKKVVEFMETVQPPIDFFSLSEFLRYFSSIIPNSLPVRKYVGAYINKTSTNFPSSLAFVFFAHIEMTVNLQPLANLVPLYTTPDDVYDEINKALMRRLLQKRSNDLTLERKLVEDLKPVLGRDALRETSLILNDFKCQNNLMLVCKSLWQNIIPEDKIKIPVEIEKDIIHSASKFVKSYQKLSISGLYSTVVVSAKYEKEEKTITMSVLQYNIIKMVEAGILQLAELGATKEQIKSALGPLKKAKILVKVPGGFTISKSPVAGKRLNVYESVTKQKQKKPKKEQEKPVEHFEGVKAAIVKIMKNEKKLSRQALKKGIVQLTEKLFETWDDEMERAIKALIMDSYLSVDKNDESILHYVT